MSINLINSSSAHFGSVRLVEFDSSNEKLISIGEEEGRLYVWNTDTLSPSTGNTIEEKTENYSVRSAVFPDDFSFLFGGTDKKLTFSDWPNCENYSVYLESDNDIEFVSSKWDTETIAFSDQHTIRFLDKKGNKYPEFSIDSKITWLNFSRNAKFFAYSSSDSTVVVLDANGFTQKVHKKFDLGSCHPYWGPGDFLLIPLSSSPGSIIIIDVSSLEEHIVQNPSDELSLTTAVALSNKYVLAIGDDSKQISVMQLNQDYSLTPYGKISYSGSEITSLSWGNKNTSLLAAGDSEGTIFLFEFNNNNDNKAPAENKEENVEPKSVSNEEKDSNSSAAKTLNDVLKDKPVYIMKPKTQPKKAKAKGKQQTLNLSKISAQPKPKPKKIEPKRQFVSDNSESSSEIEEANEITKGEKNKKVFLEDNDDDIDDIDESITKPAPKKSFLNEDDDDDVDENYEIEENKKAIVSPKKKQSAFLSDDNIDFDEDIDLANHNEAAAPSKENDVADDAGIPGYDDIALPDDDDLDIDDLDKVDNTNEIKKDEDEPKELDKPIPNPFNTISYIDSSTSDRFMPGSFKLQNGKTEILCWNGEGTIVMHNPGYSDSEKYIEIKPYGNSTFYPKKIEDAYEIILGTVDEYGYLISTNNTVVYHRHNTYGEEAEIVKSFPFLEDINLIACGNTFFAVATSLKYLHIFSTSGFETSVITLNGRFITMVGHENFLFVVSGRHHFDLFDIFNHSLVASGTLPIHAPLRWAGFNHFDHSVIIESGNYQLLALSYSEGIRWTPIIDLSKHFESTSKGILPLFIVEIYGNQVSGVFLDKESDELETDPFPETLRDFDFEPPTIESLLDNCVLSIVNYQNSIDKEKEARRFDRDLIKQFDSALKENKLLLAFQIAQQMKTSLGIELAIRICDQRGESGMSERLLHLKDTRNEEEDIDESTDFEIDESTEEPEPFVRTETIQKDEDEDDNQNTNEFLNKFNNEPQKPTPVADKDDNDNDDNNIEKAHPNKNESSEDDLDKPEDSFDKTNSENQDSSSREISKKPSKRSKTKKIKEKPRIQDTIESENDEENEETNRNKSNESDKDDEDEGKKKKSEIKKPYKPKSRKKLFNQKMNTSTMRALDNFGFS